jgi:hypothetical protein
MTKLAMTATQLGTSVDAIVSGVEEMGGMVDLFKKQQEMSAFEMGNYANNLSRIYALQKTGQLGSAKVVELTSIVKDLRTKGMTTEGGGVKQIGLNTLKQIGVSQEYIQALDKMSRSAERTGISLEKMIDPTKMSEAEKRKFEADEKTNRTFTERIDMLWKSIMQGFIDPLAQALGPVIDILSEVLNYIGYALKPAFMIIGGVFKVLGLLFGIVADGVKAVITAFQTMWNYLSDTFSPAIKKISELWNSFKNKLSGIFEKVGAIFEKIGKILGWLWAKALQPIFKVLSTLLGPAFEMLGKIIGWVIDGMGALLDELGKMFDFILNLIGLGDKNLEGESGLNKEQYDALFKEQKEGNTTQKETNIDLRNLVPDLKGFQTRENDAELKKNEALVNQAFPSINNKNNTVVNVNVSGVVTKQFAKTGGT